MQEKKIRERIISLVNKEVVPAIGCTEPMAVALCTAKAATTLGRRPDRIEVFLSPNMLKNAMGVGIPGTGMIGLPIAVSLGALIGKPEYELEVLKDLTPATLEQGKRYINDADIDIKLKQGNVDKLYIEVVCRAGSDMATAIISGSHTHFVYVERNGEVVMDNRGGHGGSDEEEDAPAPKATDSVKADESESETKKDEPEAKPEKKKKFIPGNFHGTKRVSLVGVEQSGDEPGTVSVRDEEGNQYDIPREELLYLTEEPKVPGKELELYAGPRDDDSPKTPGKELELYTGNEDDHAEFGPLAPFVEVKEPKPFKVDSEGVVTDPEAKESVGDRAKSWFDRTRKVAGQKFWSGWERTKGYVLNIGTNPDMTPEQVESTQKRNRVRMTAGVQITGALLAAGLVFGGIAAVKGASANEGPEPTSVDSTPTPTPSSELYGTPGGSLYGTPDDESANTQEGEQ